MIGSAGVAASHPGGSASPSAPASPGPALVPSPDHPSATPAPALTHGDLVVVAGENFTITSLPGQRTYYQGGNITVESGGTLYIENVTVTFVQFVTPTGTAAQRLAHIFHFLDEGTVKAYNSTVTTDMYVLNAYPKLNLTVTGSMYLWNSSLQFPGWVNVQGSSASLTLNASSILRNPAVTNLSEPKLLQGDENYAPTLTASAGGAINLLRSVFNNTYADNFTQNGTPTSAPLGLKENMSIGAPENLSALLTPTDPANLTRDWLYPMGITGGEFVAAYNDSGTHNTTMGISVWFNGVRYGLGTTTFKAGGSTNATLYFPANLTAAINTAGLLNYLNYTGDFGVGPSKIAIDITSVAGTAVNVSAIYLLLDPPVSYDLSATGAGSRFSTVDSTIDLTFNAVATDPYSQQSPLPWLANKISLTDGANASFANLTIPHIDPGVFETSAILPDATSHAYLYRWAAFNITGLGGALPVDDAQVTAYSALNVSQIDNATAMAANALKTWDPVIWDYLQYWDQVHQAPAYGASGFSGVPEMLLASNEITSGSLPDGYLLGDYHIRVVIPVTKNNSYSFTWSLRPYPEGSALNLPGYGMPDYGPSHTFPSYFAGFAISKINATAAGVTSTSVRIGQTFAVNVTVNDTGTAPIFSIVPALFYNATTETPLGTANDTVDLTAPGQTYTFGFSWLVNQTVTGTLGHAFNDTFVLPIQWNYGKPKLGGGAMVETIIEKIKPSLVTITGFTVSAPAAPATLDLSAAYFSTGTLHFNATNKSEASIVLIALPATNGVPNGQPGVQIASLSHNASAFRMGWLSPLSGPGLLVPGTTYVLELHASYNGYTYNYTVPGTYIVPAPASKQSFFFQKFLGLPIWIWIVIAAAAVAAAVAFLFVARRQAAGKLVECGECGSLVPETAPACPKCGAEFETDLVRCSRCASTIPASSQFCPECAAQLLGKPGEGGSDPERQGYSDFTERFRADAKKELGENYNEGSFWDWWKRQPTYLSFSQWKLQQEQGAPRAGMMAPPAPAAPRAPTAPPAAPGKGRPPAPPAALAGDRAAARRPAPPAAPPASAAAPAAAAPAAPAAAGLRPCPNCKKEIPAEYLVCPFCGSVTQ